LDLFVTYYAPLLKRPKIDPNDILEEYFCRLSLYYYYLLKAYPAPMKPPITMAGK